VYESDMAIVPAATCRPMRLMSRLAKKGMRLDVRAGICHRKKQAFYHKRLS
jgi:hypothetical protein